VASPFVVAVVKETPSELVVFKPPGLASELRPGSVEPSVLSLVAARFPGVAPKLPHRLDRVTRGLLLVCLTPEAIAFHNAQIQARAWEKYYLARVAAPQGGTAGAFLGEHKAFVTETGGRARIVRSGGKPARLEILSATAVPGRPDRWHLLIRLLTGRFHQIRVMCEALGLPLAGDPLYDPDQRDPDDFYLEHVILKYTDFDSRQPSTMFLPAYEGRGALAPALAARLEGIAAP
jgi:23S rRNA-/tRNA-specific pseudouridylate synthase